MLPCFLADDAPGSPCTLPAPAWNQLFYRILPEGLILSFPADKQLHILSPCSSHNLIFFPPYLLSRSFIICMSTDGSLSLAAGGEKGVREGKERQRPTVNLGMLSTFTRQEKASFFIDNHTIGYFQSTACILRWYCLMISCIKFILYHSLLFYFTLI